MQPQEKVMINMPKGYKGAKAMKVRILECSRSIRTLVA